MGDAGWGLGGAACLLGFYTGFGVWEAQLDVTQPLAAFPLEPDRTGTLAGVGLLLVMLWAQGLGVLGAA